MLSGVQFSCSMIWGVKAYPVRVKGADWANKGAGVERTH